MMESSSNQMKSSGTSSNYISDAEYNFGDNKNNRKLMIATSPSTDDANTNGGGMNNDKENVSSSSPTKKKPPIQHLIAGGTAGFVESSICHPLDTIKTRMQLRRQNTLKGRALGSSMRDVAGKGGSSNSGSWKDVAGKSSSSSLKDVSGGAIHRTTAATTTAATLGGGDGGATTTTATPSAKTRVSSAAASNTTVRVKPSGTTTKATARPPIPSALHDVGWQQRIVPLSTTPVVATTTSSATAGGSSTVVAPLGPLGTAKRIIQREGPLALYKGLTAVYTGIIPKMAIRFVSFEYYRDVLGDWTNRYYSSTSVTISSGAPSSTKGPSQTVTFVAGLLSGLTEAILVVTPAEVCKIRMQSQYHSLMDPTQRIHAKYKNVVQTALLVVKEEGVSALYKGVVPTMLRQGCNQAVNFTAYNWSKKQVLAWKQKREEEKMMMSLGSNSSNRSLGGGSGGKEVQLDHWQSLLLGGLSGGMGPLVNNPLGE